MGKQKKGGKILQYFAVYFQFNYFILKTDAFHFIYHGSY